MTTPKAVLSQTYIIKQVIPATGYVAAVKYDQRDESEQVFATPVVAWAHVSIACQRRDAETWKVIDEWTDDNEMVGLVIVDGQLVPAPCRVTGIVCDNSGLVYYALAKCSDDELRQCVGAQPGAQVDRAD